jgi:hypothetical protein
MAHAADARRPSPPREHRPGRQGAIATLRDARPGSPRLVNDAERCSYVLSRPVSGSASRAVICSARCSALVRDRPMVVMTLRRPRRSRMSQACPGGCPRELEEPVSISTVMAGMDVTFRVWRGTGAQAGAAGVADKTGRGRSGWRAGSYEVTWPAGRVWIGDGRRIVRRPAVNAAADSGVRPSPGSGR